jgi:hypothetical protein
MKHPHKDIIDAWTADMTLEIEGFGGNRTWYLTTIDEVIYNPEQAFRIKPKERCVTIDGVEYKFPEPLRVAPEKDRNYFTPWSGGIHEFTWNGQVCDKDALTAGYIQATEAGAKAQRRAIIALNGGLE